MRIFFFLRCPSAVFFFFRSARGNEGTLGTFFRNLCHGTSRHVKYPRTPTLAFPSRSSVARAARLLSEDHLVESVHLVGGADAQGRALVDGVDLDVEH